MSEPPESIEIRNAQDFKNYFKISDQVVDRLECYEQLLKRWQSAVNLVAPKTLDEVWHRHFADSAQLAPLIPVNAKSVVDLGSGGGFPVLVLAIVLADRGLKFTAVESDQRKCAFLRDVARAVEIDVKVLSTRIESDASVRTVGTADVVTARALAPLSRLFALARPYCETSTVCVFPKGRDVSSELEDARRAWRFAVELVPSLTDRDAKIAVVKDLTRAVEG